jgi:hypothetical protein
MFGVGLADSFFAAGLLERNDRWILIQQGAAAWYRWNGSSNAHLKLVVVTNNLI